MNQHGSVGSAIGQRPSPSMFALRNSLERGATPEMKRTRAWAGFAPSQRGCRGLTCPPCLGSNERFQLPRVTQNYGYGALQRRDTPIWRSIRLPQNVPGRRPKRLPTSWERPNGNRVQKESSESSVFLRVTAVAPRQWLAMHSYLRWRVAMWADRFDTLKCSAMVLTKPSDMGKPSRSSNAP